MTGSQAPAAEEFFIELGKLREATRAVSYATLVRQADAQRPPLQITAQRLSDWFGGKAVPADFAVVRFLVGYLQPRAPRTSGYQPRRLTWWETVHQEAVRQRQAAAHERRRAPDPAPRLHRLGRPIDQCDPLALEVHPAIQVPGTNAPADLLPGYVPRAHDARLREVADQVLGGGASRLVTLVGRSSTGKTRACWELARHVDGKQPGRWRVWHPYDPTQPQAVLAGLERVGPYTLVWLNDAQHYLMPPDPGLGEPVAAGLRTLVHDPTRGPVLVLATLWPQFWDTLTTRPAAGEPDPHAQARELLTGTGSTVSVADTFAPDQVTMLVGAAVDSRVRCAAVRAEGGRITQYLAGAPELEARYRTADPAVRATIHVAMDARRLGHPLALPQALIEQAAQGYLDDHDWDALDEDWLDQALADTRRGCKGTRGPLTRIRSRPGHPAPEGGRRCFRLADYLEQIGRHERAALYPPDSLWRAFAATITDPDLLRTLGWEARKRGRYQHAIWLHTAAADHSDPAALWDLAELREQAGDTAGAETLYRQAADRGITSPERFWRTTAPVIDPAVLRDLDRRRAEALAVRTANRGDPTDLCLRAWRREEAGDAAGAEALAVQAADHGSTTALLDLALRREKAGDAARAEALAVQAADRGNDTRALWSLARLREETGDAVGAEGLAALIAGRGNPTAWLGLARLREEAGDAAGAHAMAVRAANYGNDTMLSALAWRREETGDASASRMRRFGLTGTGKVATMLDFGSYGGPVIG